MAGKLKTAFFCLLFAIPFGGVGVFASWAIGKTLWDAQRAQSWVRVKATVEDATLHSSTGGKGGTTYRAEGRYSYAFRGTGYSGSRLGIAAVGGGDNIDDWHHEVTARLEEARAAGRPVTVWVNPDNPAEAVLDRAVRWKEVIFLVPFSLAFGGVGVGALVAMVLVLGGKGGEAAGGKSALQARLDEASARSGDKGGAGFLWIFAFFWNALSFPIAILVLPEIVERGEWVGLFVLLFPLVGIGLVWAAIGATRSAWRARLGASRPAPAVRQPAGSPGSFSAQAARAMFDPQGAAALKRPAAAAEPAIPASIAAVEEHGGALTLRYSRRRNIGQAVALFITGAVLGAIGVAILAADGIGFAAAILLVLSCLCDLGAVAVIAGRLEVAVRGHELAVEKGGLFGRRSWKARRDEIARLRPGVSYTINGVPYFSLAAELRSGGKIPVGDGLKGEELADAVARRIARALGLDPAAVERADRRTMAMSA